MNPLFGEISTDGIALIEHTSAAPFIQHLPKNALHLIFNLKGAGIILDQQLRLSLTPGTISIFHRSPAGLTSAARLAPDAQHHFITLSITSEWIHKTFNTSDQSLHPALRNILTPEINFNILRSLSLYETELTGDLIDPPVPKAAAPFWYHAKIIEILTLHLFTPQSLTQNTPFCSTLRDTRLKRSEQCILWLKQNLDQPLDLKALSTSIGVAPHYLSRQFSEATGTTLTKKLRQLRIDKAASLLSDGDYNVTEAAMEVGYNSLSHFTKAFLQEKGIRPSELITSLKS